MYLDFYIYNNLTTLVSFQMSLVPFNAGWSDTKKLHLLQYKKISGLIKKIVFRSASSFALYTPTAMGLESQISTF